MSNTLQETQGRKGRPITDNDAQDITRIEELSYDLRIFEVMSREVFTLAPAQTMREGIELLRVKRISGAPVVADGQLVGILSTEDLMRALTQNDLNAPIRNYMTVNVISVKSYEPVVKAIETFTRTNIGRLPVTNEKDELVGMITKGDITRGVLVAIRKDYKEEEIRRYRVRHLFEDITSDRTSLILRYQIKPRDFVNGGQASSHIKRAMLRLGATAQLARQCGIAVYEAEMNLIIHTTNGGILRVQIEPHRILMQTTDDGPGIPDVNKALQPGWSTAPQEARNMGFGAGMGLVNIKSCVDKMEIFSGAGKGTRLMMEIHLRPEEKFSAAEGTEEPGI